MNISPSVDRGFSVVIKECYEICPLDRNLCLEFIAIWKCLDVLEEKSCRRYIFSREDKFMLKYDNSDMKIFKFLSVLKCHGG